MAKLIELPTIIDERGVLTVIEKILPFDIKRVFYIYNCDGQTRGNHSHKVNQNALISVNGSCDIICTNQTFVLDSPEKCLILESSDHHIMTNFKNNCVLLVLNSDFFNKEDYVEQSN